jgi:hypothetical protein
MEPLTYTTVSLTSIEVARKTHQRTVMHGQVENAEVKGSQSMLLASSCCFLQFPWVAFARPCTAAYLLSLQVVAKAIQSHITAAAPPIHQPTFLTPSNFSGTETVLPHVNTACL